LFAVAEEGDVLEIPGVVRKGLERRGGIEGLIGILPDDESINNLVRALRTLSDPIRLRILGLLEAQALCPCILIQAVGVSDSKLSYHLSALQQSGLIEGRQEGRWIVYSLTKKGRDCMKTITNLP
jgi:DNA-binding transcriptional ArsR family regulator